MLLWFYASGKEVIGRVDKPPLQKYVALRHTFFCCFLFFTPGSYWQKDKKGNCLTSFFFSSSYNDIKRLRGKKEKQSKKNPNPKSKTEPIQILYSVPARNQSGILILIHLIPSSKYSPYRSAANNFFWIFLQKWK